MSDQEPWDEELDQMREQWQIYLPGPRLSKWRVALETIAIMAAILAAAALVTFVIMPWLLLLFSYFGDWFWFAEEWYRDYIDWVMRVGGKG